MGRWLKNEGRFYLLSPAPGMAHITGHAFKQEGHRIVLLNR